MENIIGGPMYDLNAFDLAFTAILAAMVPVLVYIYLRKPHFSQRDRHIVVLGGILWMAYAPFSETLASLLGVFWFDARYHAYVAYDLVYFMEKGDWQFVWDYVKAGNKAYHLYSGFLMYMGGSMFSATALNGWLAFWGGLILASHFGKVGPFPYKNRRTWLLLIIFFPSVIFWCTTNLKEAFVYWAICCVFSVVFVSGMRQLAMKIPLVLIAILVGAVARPHVMTGWVMAVGSVSLFQSQRRAWALIMLLMLPIVVISTKQMTGVEFSTESVLDEAETRSHSLDQLEKASGRGDVESGSRIFFVSGFISAFFKPFPWKVTSLRLLMQFIETWGMTILLITVWRKSSKSDLQIALKLPATRVAILASIWLCLLLTYYPNEGLMVRQRIQMIPGLLALAVLPVLVRQVSLAREEYRRRILDAPFLARQ